MIIDLSNPQSQFKDTKVLLSLKFLEYFNTYLEQLYESNNFSKEALLLPTLYSNTYVSNIFHDLKDLYTLKHLINQGLKLDKVVTSNYYLSKAIKSDESFRNINIEYKPSFFKATKIVKYFFFLFFVYIYSKFLPKKNIIFLRKRKLIFLEIFLSKKPKNINDCINHYYPNIFQNLSKDERDQIVIFPSFYNINSMSAVKTFSRVIKDSKINSYFSESHISIKKLFAPYIAAKKSIKDFKNIPLFLNMNVDELLINASYNSIYTRSSFYTFLRFNDLHDNNKFTNNHKFICWNENHGLDRAINLAFDKKDNPEVIGHQGLMPSFLKNSYIPKDYEVKRNLWPSEVHTLFKLSVSIPYINFKQAPAFRYADFFHRMKYCKKRPQIFIGLNLNNNEAMELLDLVIRLQKKIKDKFIIRPHPLTLKSTLEYIDKELSFAVISKGDYKKDLAESKIFLSQGDTSLYLQSFFGGTLAINSAVDYIDSTFLLSNTPYYKHTNCVEDIVKTYNSPIVISEETIDFYLNKFKEPTPANIKSFLFK